MKVLVTGGLGFIGSNFIRFMLGKYPALRIVNLDKQTYAAGPDNLKDIRARRRYRCIRGDICDEKTVLGAMRGCAAVVNFAAETHVDRSIRDAREFVRTNVGGVHVLLEAARSLRVPRFIQVSTDEVYGSRLRGSFREGDALEPNSPYAASKAGADLLVRSYLKTHGFAAIITRSSNNFGPYQFPEKVIPLFITNLLENKKVPLYGDGGNMRDWIYVLDNCRAVDLLLRKGKAGETYNIAAGNEMRNLELTKKILRLMRMPRSFIEPVRDRPGHDRRYSVDTGKIRRLGFKPEYDFSRALALTAEWYKRNQAWWKKLKERNLS